MDDLICFEIYDGNLTSEMYLQLLRGPISNFLDNLPLNRYANCWYQMDGAPAHSTHAVARELTAMFQDRWIGRNGPWLWPPRSPDLTPLDFYLWGHIKNQVYATPIHTREELLERVRRSFRELDGNQIRRATTTEVNSRILCCLAQDGRHIEHLR